MDSGKILLTGISCAGAAALARSAYETRHIKLTGYCLCSEKIAPGVKIKIAFLTDLHSNSYGRKNIRLLSLVRQLNPDLILLGGDMVTASGSSYAKDTEVLELLWALKKIAPVYYAVGNHEEYLKTEIGRFGQRFQRIKSFLEKADIPLLENSGIDLDNNISVYGLEISRKYYRRFNRKAPRADRLEALLGKPDRTRYNILLAHNPAFFDVYSKWKGDLVLCGHYHGGIIGIPDFKGTGRKRGLISPDLKLFPDYCRGYFRKNNTDLIVSAGCGTHSINFRLFNRPEVIVIELSSKTEQL